MKILRNRASLLLVAAAVGLSGLAVPAIAVTQAQIDKAIADGLAWLATQQQSSGRIGGSYPLAETATAVLAFENEGHFPGGGTLYSPVVEKGLDFMFLNYARVGGINGQTHGNPDSNGNGIGVYFDSGIGETLYEVGIALQTIVASQTQGRQVAGGPLAGMTYLQVVQDMVDWIAWAQIDAGSGRGGWRYGSYNNASGSGDNSVSQWPVLGLVAAEQWGVTAPQFVKDELNLWVAYIQNANGGSGYDGPNSMVNIAKTGGLLVEFFYLGDNKSTARAQNALNYINSQWNVGPTGDCWTGNKGQPYAMFSVFKGLELMKVATIPNALAHLPDTPAGDWYGDYADYLVNSQLHPGAGLGYWGGYCYWDNWLSTGWYIVILQATVFPVSTTVQVPECACDTAGYDVTIAYSVERFTVDGTLQVYEDGTLMDTVILSGFNGSAVHSLHVTADTLGNHVWKAVLDVTPVGGGSPGRAESQATLKVCETPKVAGIPDQTTPFLQFDLDGYLTYGGGLAVSWSVGGVPPSWTVSIDADNVVTVTAPPDAAAPATLTFTASVECCAGVICAGSDDAVFTPNRPPVAKCKDITVDADPGICAVMAVQPGQVDDGSFDPDNNPITLSIFPPGPYPLGQTVVTLTVTDPLQASDSCTATIAVVDNQKPVASCIPTTNPSGNNIPKAGNNPKSGQNPDGFYQLLGMDNCGPPAIWVADSGSGFIAGPFSPGDKVKITQAPGVTPNQKPMSGVIQAHLQFRGDAMVFAVDASGNISAASNCMVPPPPK